MKLPAFPSFASAKVITAATAAKVIPALKSAPTSVWAFIKGVPKMNPLALLSLGSLQSYAIAAAVVAVVSFGGGWHLKARLDESSFLKAKIVAQQEFQRQTLASTAAVQAAQAREAAAISQAQKDEEAVNAYALKFSKAPAGCGLSRADARRLRKFAK
jgi:hypothetical protein